jgi:serine/threonine-protein kinase
MSHNENASSADRNLLFGILAVQVNFIDSDTLVAAMNSWVVDKQKPLGRILVDQQKLTDEQLAAIDGLIEQHLKMHGGDPELSLVSTRGGLESTVSLDSTHNFDVQASLAKLRSSQGPGDTTTDWHPASGDGRYLKLRHHAGGGLGDVFVARDTELHREVALKEIKPKHADDAISRQRFVLEAEITGGLEHPGIVPVYGLGTYASGRPYYAMRFIRGDNFEAAIREFHAAEKPGRAAGERTLAFRQLLRRFVDVCNAVAYAHSRGVLHRDLKPKNVMLGKFGETLVVDWGLAKAGVKEADARPASGPEEERTLHPASGGSREVTLDGMRVGTPPFMSPEQAAGRVTELGPASDIYSLGSSLYVLLTGAHPYAGETSIEILKKVQQGQFAPPRQVKKETPAALDAICCKAMSRFPQDRYPTVLELAADVEHYLADEPVEAYAEPWTARAGRWARRHRTAVLSAGTFLLCSTVALGVSTALISVEQGRTEQQRKLAVGNYKIARGQSLEIIKLIESAEPELAQLPVLHQRRAELLATTSSACQKFLEQDPDDEELLPRAANIYRFAANFHRLTFEHDKAEPLYQDSIAVRRRLLATLDSDEDRAQLGEVLRDYAALQKDRGRLREAAEEIGRALEIAEELWRRVPDNPANQRSLGLLLLNRAFLENRLGKPVTGAAIERAIDLLRKVAEAPAALRHPYDPLLLAAALNQRAIIEREGGDLEAAQKTHAEAVKLLMDLRDAKQLGTFEGDVVHFLAECQIEQSATWAKIDKPNYRSNAEKNTGLALNKIAELAHNYPQLPTYRDALAKAFRARGDLRLQGKNFIGAREHYHSAADVLVALNAEHDAVPNLHGELGRTYTGLGIAARELKDEDASKWFELAATELQAARKLSPDDVHWRRAWDDLTAASKPAAALRRSRVRDIVHRHIRDWLLVRRGRIERDDGVHDIQRDAQQPVDGIASTCPKIADELERQSLLIGLRHNRRLKTERIVQVGDGYVKDCSKFWIGRVVNIWKRWSLLFQEEMARLARTHVHTLAALRLVRHAQISL